MSRNLVILIIVILAIVSIACGITIDLPVDKISVGALQTVPISVAEPAAVSADVELSFGAGELEIDPGAGEGQLISGTATFNVPDFQPQIEIEGSEVRLETGDLKIEGIPELNNDIKNEWDLKLSNMPMNLKINAGAYQGDFELGGLAIQSLEVNDAASNTELSFSAPNLIEMETLSYTTGASNVELNGLANANFKSMVFRSGGGNYDLDFSGQMMRDATVTIESGVSQIVIRVPKGSSALVTFEGGLTNISASGAWVKAGDRYVLDGTGPVLTIKVNMGAGNLELRTID